MRCRATPHSKASHNSIAGTAPLRTTSTSALCLSGFLALDTIHPSDSTFGFGSEIPSNFIFWLSFLDVSPILCRPFLCDQPFQSQTHGKPAWSRLLTCMPWIKPPRPLPQHPGTQVAEMPTEDYLRSFNKRSHELACLSRTWLRREPHARTTWLEQPSKYRLISTTRFKCNYRNNCKHYVKTILQMTLRR